MAAPRLLADIGGTNARFALQPGEGDGAPEAVQVLATADYADMASAARAYLSMASPSEPPRLAAFAVAAPVAGERIELTNSAWSFSTPELKDALELDAVHVVNDFVAVALSVMKLGPNDARKIGGGTGIPATPIAVLGPGTGLGVSGLVPTESGWMPLATEGGHVTLPATTDREDAVIARLRETFGHVSAERAISGPGLVNLYTALAELGGSESERLTPEEITRRAVDNLCPICAEAWTLFCALLGTVAGNLALSAGARGGVFIAGGIVPDVIDAFASSPFRDRFEDKGRFRPYMEAIPTYVMTRDMPALLGLAAVLDASAPAG